MTPYVCSHHKEDHSNTPSPLHEMGSSIPSLASLHRPDRQDDDGLSVYHGRDVQSQCGESTNNMTDENGKKHVLGPLDSPIRLRLMSTASWSSLSLWRTLRNMSRTTRTSSARSTTAATKRTSCVAAQGLSVLPHDPLLCSAQSARGSETIGGAVGSTVRVSAMPCSMRQISRQCARSWRDINSNKER